MLSEDGAKPNERKEEEEEKKTPTLNLPNWSRNHKQIFIQ